MPTVNEIRNELPTIRVSYRGKKWWAKVSGRQNQFATVSPYETVNGDERIKDRGTCFEFSWESVHRAATENATLQCGE